MKKIFASSVFVAVFACGLLLAPTVHAAPPACTSVLFAGGDGTSGNPWQIATAQQLANVTACADDDEEYHYYVQTASIHLHEYIEEMDDPSEGWWPIGAWYDDADGGQWTYSPFHGHYDGNGYIVYNLWIDRPSEGGQGLFGEIAVGSTVSNVGIDNAIVTGAGDVGALAGINGGIISRSYVSSGDIEAADGSAGGMVGRMQSGHIEDSYAVTEVAAGQYDQAGGLAGAMAPGSSIERSYAAAPTVSAGGGGMVGGLAAGGETAFYIDDSFAASAIASGDFQGGLVGKWGDATGAENNYWLDTEGSPDTCTHPDFDGNLTTEQCSSVDDFEWFTNGENAPISAWDIEIRNDPSIATINGGLPVLAWQIDGSSASTVWVIHGVPAPDTYALSFDTQGGSAVADIEDLEEDEEVELPASPTRSGYVFEHWYTTANGTGGTAYEAGATYTMSDANVTLYAIWSEEEEEIEEEEPSRSRSGRSGQRRVVAPPAQPAPSTAPTSVPTSVCAPYMKGFIQLGANNDSEEVKKLETFLNEKQGESLTVDGVYSAEDAEAVKRFQRKFASEVLGVWGLSEPTGYVYRTTLMKINSFYCDQAITCPAFVEHNSLTENTVSAEVAKTKVLLTELGFYTGAISNVFDAPLHSALTSFQETFSDTMLKPWGLTSGTGYKYKTTNKFLNLVVGCQTPAVELDGQGTFNY